MENIGVIHKWVLVSIRLKKATRSFILLFSCSFYTEPTLIHTNCCNHSLSRFSLSFFLKSSRIWAYCFLNLGLRKLWPIIHSPVNLKVNYISLLVGWYTWKSESHQEGNPTWRYIWVSTSIVCERNSFPKGMWYWLWLTVKDNFEVMF